MSVGSNDEVYRVFTRGFRHGIDATVALSAAMIAVSLASKHSPGYYSIDLSVSLVLFVSGVFSGVPWPLLLVSSIPGALLGGLGFPRLDIVYLVLGVARTIRVFWDVKWFARNASKLGREITVLATQTVLLTAAVLAGGTVALYVAEHGAPGSHINSVWDALWAVIVTATTVGYGDTIPVTAEGRIIASLIMILGVGIMMFLLSNLATIITKVTVHEEIESMLSASDRIKRDIKKMVDMIDELDEDGFERLVGMLRTLWAIERSSDSVSVDLLEGYRPPSAEELVTRLESLINNMNNISIIGERKHKALETG